MTDREIIEEIYRLDLDIPSSLMDSIKGYLNREKLLKLHLTPIDIKEVVFKYYNLSLNPSYNKTRKREYVDARMFVFYIVRNKLKLSLAVTGLLFEKDHATVLHAFKTMNNLLSYDNHYVNELAVIEELLITLSMEKIANNKILIGA